MTDILVIGGGIAGVSVAARLSKDANVTVLEAEPALGYHASGRSAAVHEPSYGAPSVQALSHSSLEYLTEHDDGYLSPRGLLLVATAQQEKAFRADLSDMGLDEISAQDALNFVPTLNPQTLRFAGFHAKAQDIDADRLLQGFARETRKNGAQIKINQRVSAIHLENTRWHVTTQDASYSADLLINAAGAWADGIATMAGLPPIGITPYRRSIARVPAPQGHDVGRWPLMFGVNESWYAKPDAGFLLVSPADQDPTEPHDAWAEDITLAQGIARYEEMVTSTVTRLQSSWAGLRSFAPDRTLVLGPDPENAAFIWCAGQGGYGIQTSPAASKFVADLVTDRPPELASDIARQLTPDRLR
ncbi:MAG: FAD-dependent oxidoreductase [Roseobacter sp.]